LHTANRERTFVSCAPTGGTASSTPIGNPSPNPRARVSCGERPAPTTGPARAAANRGAPSCSRRRAVGRLEDPPGLSPITTVGRFDTVEAARVATDAVCLAVVKQRVDE
jgi:hypothetical protein